MSEWEKKFDELALKKGETLWLEGKVHNLKKSDTEITAYCSGKQSYSVTIMLRNGTPGRMRCQCPKARMGSNCEHMAAALYAVFGYGAERIAKRDAEKAAKRAESKSKRQETEKKARLLKQEAEQKKLLEEQAQKEEAARKAAEAAKRKAEEEAVRKRAEEESARKKAKKVLAAAVRAAKEKEEQAERDIRDAAQKMERNTGDDRMKETDYSYFNMNKIKEALKISAADMREGRMLAETGQIILEKFQTGYTEEHDGMVADIWAQCIAGKNKFKIRLFLTRTEVLYSGCECPQCRKSNYWYSRLDNCCHIAGMLKAIEEYLKKNAVGDATDKSGMEFMTAFQAQRAYQVVAEMVREEESLNLVPRLQHQHGRLALSFKFGNNKLFVIKNLFEFRRHVLNSETAVYGSNTAINHQLNNLTRRSREWFDYINKVVQEEQELELRLQESGWFYSKSGHKRSALELYGWRLDQFYELMQDEAVEYEDKSQDIRKKQMLRTKEANPKVNMQIKKNTLGEKNAFHGVNVTCRMPVFFKGAEASYFVENTYFCKADTGFMEQIKLLSEQARGGRVNFQVGRNNLSEFYYTVLPQLGSVVDIEEENSQEIQEYLPPEVQFFFYLDAENRNITCRVHAKYGEHEHTVLDSLVKDGSRPLETYRMNGKEAEILHIARRLLPEVDLDADELHCGHDEERMYQVLEHGVETLMEYGEVQCTRKFSGMNVIRKAKVSLGVSVSSGLLNLDIVTEDISREELVDVLKSYRTRKTFHRLKNGDFLKLEDTTWDMMADMMKTMRISPGELAKGKLQLPVYRTLYLDRLLEEKDIVYSTRDSHFREIVKSFKTVNDADFEEPASLSGIMRGYQKMGYRWLRTLEAYQFGGILADDMGLGKTLQVIAVLLSAKEEGKSGTSLVVSPASLVFNWGEELARFAPQLEVLLVTGSLDERQQKLAQYQSYDVLVTSYDLLKRDIALYEDKQFLYEIIDEAQYIKNHTTAAAKAVKVIKSRTRYAMTGTPIENRLSELWSIFDYLMPGFLYGYDVFKKELETPIVKNGDEDAMKRLQRMVGTFILRRLKGDVLKDLPDKLEEIRYVKMDNTQQKVYDAQVVKMQMELSGQDESQFSKNKIQILAQLTRLRQVCCDPSLCFENYNGESAKLEASLELIQSAIDGGHKILLFSQFTTMLEILEQRLQAMGIGFYVITGATGKEKRLQMVKAFNEDSTPVFLISLKAGGVGLNLTGADVVIHYDPWWNLAVQNQATDRAHRIGQTKKVTVYKLIIKHSIEEKIQKLQETKKDLADQIVNAQSGQLGSMSKEELLELLEA